MTQIYILSSCSYIMVYCVCCVCAKPLQSCPTLCRPMNCSLSGSSVHVTLQARILEWVAMPFSRGSSQLRDTIYSSIIAWRIPWTEYWSGLPFPSPGDLPDPGDKSGSPALQADTLPSEPPGKPNRHLTSEIIVKWR